MESVTRVGSSAWATADRPSRQQTGFADAWAEVSAATTGSSSAATTQDPPARSSMLIALQDVRLNRPVVDTEKKVGEDVAEDTGKPPEAETLFATGEDAAGERSPIDDVIEEIKEKGLAEWAHEQWLERIREKARQAALADLGLTEDDLAAMSPDMQARIEAMIKEVVEEAVRQATEKAADENGKERAGQAMVVSPIITGG